MKTAHQCAGRSERGAHGGWHGLCSPSPQGSWHWNAGDAGHAEAHSVLTSKTKGEHPHRYQLCSQSGAGGEPAGTPLPPQDRTAFPTHSRLSTDTRHLTGHVTNRPLRLTEERPNYPVGHLFWLV